MKMKKTVALILNLILIASFIFAIQITASAAEPSQSNESFNLQFELTADNGRSVYLVNPGQVITVSFTMKRTDSIENYTTNGFQNYIHYDLSFFEFVENSIVLYDTGIASAKKLNSITHGEIVQCQNMGSTYVSEFLFCTFQLRVMQTAGSGMVYNDEVYAFDTSYEEVKVSKQNLFVMIDTGCTHANTTKVTSKEPTCYEKGWESYYDCDTCDAILDESGDLIAGIPYIDEAHTYSDVLSSDTLGHWYPCVECGQRYRYSSHKGGEATCTTKAECRVCGAEYGNFDKNNHTGTAYVKDKKVTWFWVDGYSGDICCSHCEGIIEEGQVISMFTISAWPLWAIIVSVPLFPLVIIGWFFIMFF